MPARKQYAANGASVRFSVGEICRKEFHGKIGEKRRSQGADQRDLDRRSVPEKNNCGNSSNRRRADDRRCEQEMKTAPHPRGKDPMSKPPAIAEPVRENPGMSARICIVPILIPCQKESFAMRASLPGTFDGSLFFCAAKIPRPRAKSHSASTRVPRMMP